MNNEMAWFVAVVIIAGAASLSGCMKPAMIKPIESVDRAVQVSCIDQLPAAPKLHSDAEIKAMSDYDATITLRSDRILSEIYRARLETVIEGCK